jgi:hypothetical protein
LTRLEGRRLEGKGRRGLSFKSIIVESMFDVVTVGVRRWVVPFIGHK